MSMASPRYRHTTTGVANIPARGWLHMYSAIAGGAEATIQITDDDGPLDPILVPANSAFGDSSSNPARAVIMGPMTIEITNATRFIVAWFEP